MADETPETRSDRAWSVVTSWIGRITAVVGLCATIGGGLTWLITHHRQHQQRAAQLALAETQATQGDYQASLDSYAALLRSDPLDHAALEGQLNAAMLWAENYHIVVPEGQSATEPAGRQLDEMMSILESGLTRSKGTRAADVQAHLGWAHWLNQHIAAREFGPAAEQNLRAALTTDPNNVYANGMLGNWMLQNGGDFDEAIQHFDLAIATGKALPLVRGLQLGALIYDEQPGARRELMKVANAMRTHGEPIDRGERHRIFGFCCAFLRDHKEVVESLSALPAQDAWQTYLWLEDAAGPDLSGPQALLRTLTHDYVQAMLLEISGNRPEALRQYRMVQQKLRQQRGERGNSLDDAVNASITRLTHS
ncbi:MAG TPA: hypothetical protein VJV22_17965 [Acidobacteriaceae bacterium]|nr:hypothetical protein [Acidobacteriaceae bacterium]